MKSVLISIKPKWCEKIANGEKTIEVRKTAPKCEVPFKAYIYCTKEKKQDDIIWAGIFGDRGKWNGRVIGEFVCDRITDISVVVRNCNENYNEVYHNDECKGSCLTWKELQEYGKDKPLYGWHISDLKIYDKPKELSEFKKTKELIARTCGMQAMNGLCRAIDHEELCDNIKCCFKTPCPPQSWCYVEELQEKQK